MGEGAFPGNGSPNASVVSIKFDSKAAINWAKGLTAEWQRREIA